MGIKRNEVAEPQWKLDDYARIDKENLFSDELWKRTISWNLLLEQIKKIENVCQLIDLRTYPSRLFSAYMDILEANLYVLDDIFYFQTGIRVGKFYNPSSAFKDLYSLRFWNLDHYEEIKKSYEGLKQTKTHLIECLKHKALSVVADEVVKKSRYDIEWEKIDPIDLGIGFYFYQSEYSYACKAYRKSVKDNDALVEQIVGILNFINNYKDLLFFFINDITIRAFDFDDMVTSFRESEKGHKLIKPWKRDFEGSRDSLIIKMEKDPELGPWVNRFTHLRDDKDVTAQLFCDDDGLAKNKEEICNTDNWIRLLTIAAVLQEYDEQQDAVVTDVSDEDDTILLKLSPYFKDEATIKRFLNSVRLLNDKEIIALVKKYRDAGLCTDISKGLWKVLHDANLYKPLYKNWNAQINKR